MRNCVRSPFRMGRFSRVLLATAGVSVGACSDESSSEFERVATIEQPFENQFILNPIHESITLAALPFLREPVLNYLAWENASFDFRNFAFADAHFDNCVFKDSSARVAENMALAVEHVGEFPAEVDLPTAPFGTGILAPLPQGAQSLASFAAVLHAMQDFYSHTNWVEHGKRVLFNADLDLLPEIQPYEPLGGLIVLDEYGQGWSVHSAPRAAVYPASTLVTAKKRGASFPALLSGTYATSIPHNCPQIRGPGLTDITHDGVLAKDRASDHPVEHVIAVGLATQQTTHEWCRFQNLVYEQGLARGTAAEDIELLCENWVEDAAEANRACPTLPPDARCPVALMKLSGYSAVGGYYDTEFWANLPESTKFSAEVTSGRDFDFSNNGFTLHVSANLTSTGFMVDVDATSTNPDPIGPFVLTAARGWVDFETTRPSALVASETTGACEMERFPGAPDPMISCGPLSCSTYAFGWAYLGSYLANGSQFWIHEEGAHYPPNNLDATCTQSLHLEYAFLSPSD